MKRGLFGLILLAALSLSVLLASELLLRARYRKIERITGVAPWTNRTWKGLTYSWDQYHPTLGWTNLPGYRSDSKVPYRVSINNQGLRGQEDYPPLPAPGIERIAIFGDSCAFGDEVDDEASVPALLEEELPGSEVLNFGVRGYCLGQMTTRFEEEGLVFHPRQVLFLLLMPEGIGRISRSYLLHAKPVFALQQGMLVRLNVPVPVASGQPWPLRHSFLAAWFWGRPPRWPRQLSDQDRLLVASTLLHRARMRCRAEGVRFSVVTLVTARVLELRKTDENIRQGLAFFLDALAGSDLDVLDLTEPLAGAYQREGRALVAPQGHWSRQGNSLITRWIAEHLRGG